MVQIKPRETKKWHGKVEIEDFSRPKTIVAAIDPSTMQYKVVFTAQERELLEKTGYDVSLEARPNTPHPTWDSLTGKLVLESNTLVLDPNNPLDLIKLGVARGANRHVAPSLDAADNDSEYSEATHFIFSEEVELEDRVKKITLKQEANKLLYEMSVEKMAMIVTVVGSQTVKGKSADFIRAKADELVETDPASFLYWAKLSPEQLNLFSAVETAIIDNHIIKRAGEYTFLDEGLGFSKQDVVEYLSKKENQALKLKLLELARKK